MAAGILTENAPTALWLDLVRESAQRAGVTLDEELESHLVFVLMRHLGDAGLGARVLALDYLEALLAQGSQRTRALRETGDRCLLIAGLFPEQAQRRRVSPGRATTASEPVSRRCLRSRMSSTYSMQNVPLRPATVPGPARQPGPP